MINKRCPFCPALFKVRSALESHLATKHADNYSKGEINIDTLPDAEQSNIDGANAAAANPGGPPVAENATAPVLAQPPPLPGRIISTKRFIYKRLKVALPHSQFFFAGV